MQNILVQFEDWVRLEQARQFLNISSKLWSHLTTSGNTPIDPAEEMNPGPVYDHGDFFDIFMMVSVPACQTNPKKQKKYHFRKYETMHFMILSRLAANRINWSVS